MEVSADGVNGIGVVRTGVSYKEDQDGEFVAKPFIPHTHRFLADVQSTENILFRIPRGTAAVLFIDGQQVNFKFFIQLFLLFERQSSRLQLRTRALQRAFQLAVEDLKSN